MRPYGAKRYEMPACRYGCCAGGGQKRLVRTKGGPCSNVSRSTLKHRARQQNKRIASEY